MSTMRARLSISKASRMGVRLMLSSSASSRSFSGSPGFSSIVMIRLRIVWYAVSRALSDDMWSLSLQPPV